MSDRTLPLSNILPPPVSAAEVAATRRPTQSASMLPPRVLHDPDVLAWEQAEWFAKGWICIGREEDIALPGQYVLARVAGENLIVIRDNARAVRIFFNVCRHRGATLIEEQTGRVPRIQCPYHAWAYDLDGRLHRPRHTGVLDDFDPDCFGLVPVNRAVWQGFIFVNVSGDGPPFAEAFGDMPAYFARYDLDALRRARQIDYDVRANWKAIIENYAECYHCPGVHPQLNKITPYNLGEWLPSEGPWKASWMPVVGEHDTLTMDGQLHGRAFVPGTTEEDHKRVYYFIVWPNLLLSLHPDYLMTHRLTPLAPDQTHIACEWFFAPQSMAAPHFDPSDAIEFWDLTNRQDWHVCELQQAGTRSRGYTPGRYSAIESGVHAVDLMFADRYASDGQVTNVDRIRKDEATGNRPKGAGH
jgi:Rieske 2Fe-2S family protein